MLWFDEKSISNLHLYYLAMQISFIVLPTSGLTIIIGHIRNIAWFIFREQFKLTTYLIQPNYYTGNFQKNQNKTCLGVTVI